MNILVWCHLKLFQNCFLLSRNKVCLRFFKAHFLFLFVCFIIVFTMVLNILVMFISRYFMDFCFDCFLFGPEISYHLSPVQCPEVLMCGCIVLWVFWPFLRQESPDVHMAIGDWKEQKRRAKLKNYSQVEEFYFLVASCDWEGKFLILKVSFLNRKGVIQA